MIFFAVFIDNGTEPEVHKSDSHLVLFPVAEEI